VASPNRWLLGGGALALLFAGACFKDWDRIDPSEGTPPTASGGQGGQGGQATGGEATGGAGVGTVCTPGAEAPCYSGPVGTENVGECIGGVTTCNDDGAAFGPCAGEVIPTDENCNNALDDDCDGEVNELDAGCTCVPGTLSTCYDGPTGTDGTGICQAGQKMCEASGNTETACAGQVLPLTEECLTVDDDDCDGTANNGCPTAGAIWGNTSGDSFAWDVAVDGSNGYAFVGETQATLLDLGGGGLTPSLGLRDAIIGRYDAAGTEQWSRQFGSAGEDIAYGVAIDDAGDVYVAGYFSGTLDLTGDVAVGLTDVFIAKFNGATGANIWVTPLGDAELDQARAIAVNGAGTVIAVTGWFEGSIDVGNGAEAANDRDGFLVVLDGAGAVTTGPGQIFGGTGSDEGRTIALDGTNIIVGGSFDEDVAFGTGAAITEIDGGLDGFVAKLDSGGEQTWLKHIAGGDNQIVTQVVVDSASSVIAHGRFDTEIDFGVNTTLSLGDGDAFVVKYATGGTLTWELAVGGPGDQNDGPLAVDGNDNVWFGTSHEQQADYGGGLLYSSGGDDWAIIKLDPAGAYLKSLRFGNSGDDDPRAMDARTDDAMVLVGESTSGMDLGLGYMIGSSDEHIVVAILPP
jgi:hypothetical protein